MNSPGDEFTFSHIVHSAKDERVDGEDESPLRARGDGRRPLRSSFPWRRVSGVNAEAIERTGDVRDIEDHLHGIKTTNFAEEAEVRGYEVDSCLLKAQALAQ